MRKPDEAQRRKSRRFHVLCAFIFTTIRVVNAGGFALSEAMKRLGPVPLGVRLNYSALVLDRDGRLLRPFTTPDGYWRLPAAPEAIDQRFLSMLIAYEDKRFYSHPGVDPIAILRAASQVLWHG